VRVREGVNENYRYPTEQADMETSEFLGHKYRSELLARMGERVSELVSERVEWSGVRE